MIASRSSLRGENRRLPCRRVRSLADRREGRVGSDPNEACGFIL